MKLGLIRFQLRERSPVGLRVGKRLGSGSAFTMIEMLVVLAILAVMLTATLGVTSSISASRGMTGVHRIAAACDAARARAMKQQTPVFLAFAEGMAGDEMNDRAMLMCWSDRKNQPPPRPGVEPVTSEEELALLVDGTQNEVLVPCSEWICLPEGHVFSSIDPASSSAGRNLLKLTFNRLKIQLPGGSEVVTLPCIGFGSLGEVVYPGFDKDSSGRLLIAISENAGELAQQPETCRWIGLQRHSGTTMILP